MNRAVIKKSGSSLAALASRGVYCELYYTKPQSFQTCRLMFNLKIPGGALIIEKEIEIENGSNEA